MKFYSLRISDGDFVINYLIAFNIVLSQLAFVDVKMNKEDQYITLLCSLPNLWDSMAMTIVALSQS